jgi:fumarate reductase flavoprotein subunit
VQHANAKRTIVRAQAMPADASFVSVAIVGGGACALTAALHLRDAQIDCVVVERDARLQGSTALSSGFIPAAGTKLQQAAGVVDSASDFANDIQAKAHQTAAPHLVRAFTEHIAAAIDRLTEQHGITFELLDGFLYPGHHARRMHAVVEKSGASLMAQLERAANAAGVYIVCNSTVTELWLDANDCVIGLGYESPGYPIQHIACNALILACNGFGGNPDMVRAVLPEMANALFAGHTGNDGSALAWGEQLGAKTADLSGYQGHGSWAIPHGILISWATMMQGGIQVNRNGERFHDETQGYSEAALGVLRQPDACAWNIFDQSVVDQLKAYPDFASALAQGAIQRFDSIKALAVWIGCPAAVLAQTCAAASRPLYAPCYAVKVTGALFHTQGGLDIDDECRVLMRNGDVFKNLYAAGGAARGVSGNAVWGYLSGNGLLSAVAGGAIAARSATALLVANLTRSVVT